MKYFIEITLINNRFISSGKLWSKIYEILHLRLADAKNLRGHTNIGISFPEYYFDENKNIGILGSKLRIFAPTNLILEQINISKHLKNFSDYVHVSSIHTTPTDISGYAIYKRKRILGENEMNKKINRLATHKAKQENISYEEALLGFQHWSISQTALPNISIYSSTTKQHLKLYIDKIFMSKPSDSLSFSTYGLSNHSSVPEF